MDIVGSSVVDEISAGASVPSWYAIYTYPRHEQSVNDRLTSKSLETFLPMFVSERRWSDRRVKLNTPVFPSYVFSRIEPGQRGSVLSVPGVIRILSANGIPTPIDDKDIDTVRLCLLHGIDIEQHSSIGIGEKVRVGAGPMEGVVGVVTRRKNKCRLVIAVALINHSVSIEIEEELLAPFDQGVSMSQTFGRHILGRENSQIMH
jgi:transcription antitermination factor NusG